MKEKMKEMYAGYKKKTQGMTFREKMVDYIWEYYKIPILIIAFTIFCLGGYINSVFINPPNKSYSSLSFYGKYVSDSILSKMTTELNDSLVDPDSGFEIYPYSFYITDEDPQTSSLQIQRFAAMVTSQELDIMFVDTESFEIFVDRDYCLPLNNLLSQNDLQLLDEVLIDNDASGLYYGIDLEKCRQDFFENIGYLPTDMIMCVIINTARPENAAEIIRYMLLGNIK